MLLCEAAAGLGVPVSVSVCVGSTCPFIVFDTADIDSAVDGVIEAAFRTNTNVSGIAKRGTAPWAIFVQICRHCPPLPLIPLGPLGVVCAGKSGGERGGSPQASHGWVEVSRPVQR